MQDTKISWVNALPGRRGYTHNVTVGCSKESPGCTHCYAEKMAVRLAGMGNADYQRVITDGRWNGRVELLRNKLHTIATKKPACIFVGSMSGVFHENLSSMDHEDVVGHCTRLVGAGHVVQVLTKRPLLMADAMFTYFSAPGERIPDNLWLGTSCEDQQRTDERVEWLKHLDARVRFVSFEPLLGPITLSADQKESFEWAIIGAETGKNRRPFQMKWARSLRDQCVEAGIPVFFKGGSSVRPKQDATMLEKNGARTEWRQVPEVAE